MPKSIEIKKYATDALKQSDFKQIQQIARKTDGSPYHLDYIRKVCKGQRYNSLILKSAQSYLEKLQKFQDSFVH